MPSEENGNFGILFFDGECGLCHGLVRFLMKRSTAERLRFAPLQGETAGERLAEADRDLQSVTYLSNGEATRESSAVWRVLADLGGFWRVPSLLLRAIPRPLRDVGYRFVARHRFKVFGRKDMCELPTPKEREQLLP